MSDDPSPLGEEAPGLVAIQARSYASAGKALRRSWPEERAMDADALVAFLVSKRYAVLATTRPSRQPQASPIAFFVHQGNFWFATVAGPRLQNVRETPYGSMVISEGEGAAHRAVVAEGPITIHERLAELDARWAERHGGTPDWAAAFLELRPEHVFSFSGADR